MGKFLSMIVTGMVCLSGVKADCLTDIVSMSLFNECLNGLISERQNSGLSSPDKMCSGETRDNMICLLEYHSRCPALADVGNPLHGLKPILDQYDTYCGTADGGGFYSGVVPVPCPGFEQCYQQVLFLAGSPDMQLSEMRNSTPFSIIPDMLYTLCIVYVEQKKCRDEHRSSCPEAIKYAEDVTEKDLQRDPTFNMNMQEIDVLVEDLCPKIPAEFPKNNCVRKKLESQEFVSCIMIAMNMSTEATKDKQCKIYLDELICIEDNIGTCGPENVKAVIDAAHHLIPDHPENCRRIMNGEPTSGSDKVRSSINNLSLVLFVIALIKI